MKGKLSIEGIPTTYVAGENAAASDGELAVQHDAGVSVVSSCEEEFKADALTQFELLGRTISFTVDLSEVGCACNFAVYLVSMPALDVLGQKVRGEDRDGQPPYYCDANKVGGQWCPEVDIMEANRHVLQSTAHKCDAPVNGSYSSCDREGCSQNTDEMEGSYGPGANYTIDTRSPFVVETEFPEQDGILLGMRTILRQGSKKLVMEHHKCDPDYLRDLSAAMQDGMSMRITYWGDSFESMSWMDGAVCGATNCTADNSGEARVRSLSVSSKRELSYYKSRGFQAPTELRWVPAIYAPWQCHQYESEAQESTLWCAHADIQNGWEYSYNAGQDSPCGGCWCCKRPAYQTMTEGVVADRVWVVSGRDDLYFGQVVPGQVIDDPKLFVQTDVQGVGVAEWHGKKHFVTRVRRGELPQASGDGPGEDFLGNQDGSSSIIMKKFAWSARLSGVLSTSSQAAALLLMAVIVLLAAAAFATKRNCCSRRRRSHRSHMALIGDEAAWASDVENFEKRPQQPRLPWRFAGPVLPSSSTRGVQDEREGGMRSLIQHETV